MFKFIIIACLVITAYGRSFESNAKKIDDFSQFNLEKFVNEFKTNARLASKVLFTHLYSEFNKLDFEELSYKWNDLTYTVQEEITNFVDNIKGDLQENVMNVIAKYQNAIQKFGI